jgi:hypothetical protein
MEAVLTEEDYYNVMTPTDYIETDNHSPEQPAAHIERQNRGKKAITVRGPGSRRASRE